MVFTFFLFLAFPLTSVSSSAGLRFERVPAGGIQPQVAIGSDGRTHLLYFKGDAMGGDLFYASRPPGAKEFAPARKVNTQPGSVLVAGTMRGPQMALGRKHVQVVWMGGNGAAKAKVAGQNVTPLLYTRLAIDGSSTEPERNILTEVAGLDGGQTVAADQKGNVYVIWHGAPPHIEDEQERGLYVARSTDDGRSFAPEFKAEVPRKGACACCGIRAKVDKQGALHVLFRAAEAGVNRNELWLRSENHGKSFAIIKEDPWKIATCPASSAFLETSGETDVGAWETDNRVAAAVRRGGQITELPIPASKKQKHPTVAVNARGEVLVTWVEDAGWGTEGTLVCQLFGRNGEPVGEPVRRPKLPAWSFGAPVADGNDFLVFY